MATLKDKKILFFGTPVFAVPALEALIKAGAQVVGVVTQPDRPTGRQQVLTSSPIKMAAQKLGLPIYQPDKLTAEVCEQLLALQAQVGVVVAYGGLIPKNLLNNLAHGVLNIHPSLLPKYRGPAPIQTAILNGDAQTGVTIIVLDEQIDHGPIVGQRPIEIIADDDSQSLSYNLACEGADLLINILPDYLSGQLLPQAQTESFATFTKKITTDDGQIDWQRSPFEIDCQVRAFNPEPGAWTSIDGQRVKILKTSLLNNELVIEKVQPAGKSPMFYTDYLRGHRPLGPRR